MNDEISNLSSIEITPPRFNTNSAKIQNSSNSLDLLSTPKSLDLISQNRELTSVLDEIRNISDTGPRNNTGSTG